MNTTSGTAAAVYEAFNRLVEVQASGASTQFVYAPDGFKFAYMNGQTMQQYIAPLVGGVQAVYTAARPAGPTFWRHADWLGTVRLDFNSSQSRYFDTGWAPFGLEGSAGRLPRTVHTRGISNAEGTEKKNCSQR